MVFDPKSHFGAKETLVLFFKISKINSELFRVVRFTLLVFMVVYLVVSARKVTSKGQRLSGIARRGGCRKPTI